MTNRKQTLDEQLTDIVKDFGTPCFVYRLDETYKKIDILRKGFGNRFQISYAVKSNPNRAILHRLKGRVDTLDISSGGELTLALEAGWKPELMSFTGPGKSDEELRTAVEHGIGDIIIESAAEAVRLNSVAARAGIVPRILIRVAPANLPQGFGVNMAGKPCQFGIDEENLDIAIEKITALKNLTLGGFHIYSGTQCLSADAISENYEIFIDIFRRFCGAHEIRPEKLIFGAGLGIPYHENDQPLDLAPICERINPALDKLRGEARFGRTNFILETGRYLIGEAGLYLTRVVNKKRSRGIDFCICDGGMNHHLGACGHLGSVIHRNYQMFKVSNRKLDAQRQFRPYDLVGPLCTSIDTLGRRVKFAGLDVGDIVAVKCSGAYGLTASPIYFISHKPPKEILVENVNGTTVVNDISHVPDRLVPDSGARMGDQTCKTGSTMKAFSS